MTADRTNPFGTFLRDCRMRLDPAAFGLPAGRRRTPGLRREEVAQRAHISPTWYTWLEQGRGGAPSPAVLDRIAAGMMLTEPERDHLHILAFGHPASARFRHDLSISPRLQRVLDMLSPCPAIVRSALWDVLAWNRAASCVLTDYAKLAPEQRNILRLVFDDARVRAKQADWLEVARYVVGAFRADATRAGAGAEIRSLVDELSAASTEFRDLWQDNEVVARTEGIKRLHHPELGTIELAFSNFLVEGRPDLVMMVYSPTAPDMLKRIESLITIAST